MGAMGVMGWVRVRAAKGIMNSEFWIGHKLQACASGGKTDYGKSIPVEWKGENDAEVSIDYPHYGFDKNGKWNTGPDAPHVGWQVGKKTGKKVGHILLDDVPAGRPKKKDSNCWLWK